MVILDARLRCMPLAALNKDQRREGETIDTLTPLAILHVRKNRLETIAQRPHIRIHDLLELKSLRDNLD